MEIQNNKITIFVIIFICLALMIVNSMLWTDRYYILISFLVVTLSIILFFAKFEQRDVSAEELVLIAILSAIAAMSRIPFAPLPGIQPASFVVIMSALTFGKEIGFMVGSNVALISNIFLGHGPWTPWQMFCWGIMGYVAGSLKDTRFMKSKLGSIIYGVVAGFLYGWIMNIWFVLNFYQEDITWKVFLGSCIASFPFDRNHAISNAVFLFLFKNGWEKILERAKIKYGL